MTDLNHGPNVTKLIIRFAANETIPPGSDPFAGVVEFFHDPEKRRAIMAKAEGKAMTAIALVMSARDNPYGDDFEAVAAALLAGLAEREQSIRERDNKE